MRIVAVTALIVILSTPVCAQEARETALDSQPFQMRVERVLKDLASRQEERRQRLRSLQLATAKYPSVRDTATLLELRVKIDIQKDVVNSVRQLHDVYTSQLQKVDAAVGSNQLMQDRFQAQIAQCATEIQQQAAQIPNLQTSLRHLALLDVSPRANSLIVQIEAELTRIERNREKLQASVENLRQELQGAAVDRDSLDRAGESLRQVIAEFDKLAESADQKLGLLAQRGGYFVQRMRIQALVTESENGTDIQDVIHRLQQEADDVQLPRFEDTTVIEKPVLDPLKFSGCIKQGGEVDACRHAAGGH